MIQFRQKKIPGYLQSLDDSSRPVGLAGYGRKVHNPGTYRFAKIYSFMKGTKLNNLKYSANC